VTASSRDAVGIAGVQRLDLDEHRDERGALVEVYRRGWLEDGDEAVQANLSFSRAGVVRGLHWHRRQRDYWCVLSGRAFVALVDLREGSPTHLVTFEHEIDADVRRIALEIPPGVAHGFRAETDVTLLYLVDAYYTGDDEFGLAWDDPDVGIGWPAGTALLSERDGSNPSLADVLEDPPRFG
jgi:dTDP-4-dehydrorhamnose 3,5-epimerase